MAKCDEWVRVKSESELRVGLCVEIRLCQWCGRRERIVLLRSVALPWRVERYDGGFDPPGKTAWEVTPWCRGNGVSLGGSIREGRIYRLSDSQLTDSEATQELERVR